MEAAGATRSPWACPEGRGPGAARHEGGGGRLEDGRSARPPRPPAALTFSSARCRSCLLAFSTSEEGPLMTTVSLPEPSTGKWMWTPPHSSMMARIRRPFVPMRELCSLAGIETSASVMLAWNHTRHEGATFACGRDGRAHRARGLGQAGRRARARRRTVAVDSDRDQCFAPSPPAGLAAEARPRAPASLSP